MRFICIRNSKEVERNLSEATLLTIQSELSVLYWIWWRWMPTVMRLAATRFPLQCATYVSLNLPPPSL